ncbi:hypothetical protein [Paenibacillus solani]|uniref:hypothetical protein n=1 Tax=Paenibacillus solani TaxID=1705565 RepID=UPI003D280538
MVRIRFADGATFIVKADTVLHGYRNISSDPEKEFYLEEVYSGSIDGASEENGSRLSTTNPAVGVMGFILSVDCFTFGDNINAIYRSAAVVSVENTKLIL